LVVCDTVLVITIITVIVVGIICRLPVVVVQCISYVLRHIAYLYTNVAMITNHPSNKTVCNGSAVEIACGINSRSPNDANVHWIISIRSESGNYRVSDMSAPVINMDPKYQWIFNVSNTENVYLRVNPVNETYNQSLFQCYILRGDGDHIYSETGTLIVVGEYIRA